MSKMFEWDRPLNKVKDNYCFLTCLKKKHCWVWVTLTPKQSFNPITIVLEVNQKHWRFAYFGSYDGFKWICSLCLVVCVDLRFSRNSSFLFFYAFSRNSKSSPQMCNMSVGAESFFRFLFLIYNLHSLTPLKEPTRSQKKQDAEQDSRHEVSFVLSIFSLFFFT